MTRDGHLLRVDAVDGARIETVVVSKHDSRKADADANSDADEDPDAGSTE